MDNDFYDFSVLNKLFNVEEIKTSGKFFVKGGINEKKYTKFIKKNKFTFLIDDCIFQYDDTLFGAGDNGFIITQNAIYWSNIAQESKSLYITDIIKIEANSDDAFYITDSKKNTYKIDTTIVKTSIKIASALNKYFKLK